MGFVAKEVKNEIVEWIRNWFQKNGPDCNAVIGISGGKDSSVAAALCVEALGPERVIGLLMPNGAQFDLGDGVAIAGHLGIRYCEVNIADIYHKCLDAVILGTASLTASNWGYSEQTSINLPPRIRMTMLYAFAQSLKGRVVCTDNLSEAWVGYSTRWGDNVGDFAPLAKLTSDEVIAVGLECGLPDWAVFKTPSDGLCGKTDEDNFGFSYATLNRYIRAGICDDEAAKAKIDALHNKNMFKPQPIPTFPYSPDLTELFDGRPQ